MSKPAAQRRQQKIDAQRAHKAHMRRLNKEKRKQWEMERNEKILAGPMLLQPWDGDFVAVMHPQCAADLNAAAYKTLLQGEIGHIEGMKFVTPVTKLTKRRTRCLANHRR